MYADGAEADSAKNEIRGDSTGRILHKNLIERGADGETPETRPPSYPRTALIHMAGTRLQKDPAKGLRLDMAAVVQRALSIPEIASLRRACFRNSRFTRLHA